MFSLTKIHGDEVYKEFICDLESDVLNLPTNINRGKQVATLPHSLNDASNELCSVGSVAFVIEPVSVYMLGNDSEWHKIG